MQLLLPHLQKLKPHRQRLLQSQLHQLPKSITPRSTKKKKQLLKPHQQSNRLTSRLCNEGRGNPAFFISRLKVLPFPPLRMLSY